MCASRKQKFTTPFCFSPVQIVTRKNGGGTILFLRLRDRGKLKSCRRPLSLTPHHYWDGRRRCCTHKLLFAATVREREVRTKNNKDPLLFSPPGRRGKDIVRKKCSSSFFLPRAFRRCSSNQGRKRGTRRKVCNWGGEALWTGGIHGIDRKNNKNYCWFLRNKKGILRCKHFYYYLANSAPAEESEA